MAIIENEQREGFWHPKPWPGLEGFPVWLASHRGSKDEGKRKPLRELFPSLMDRLDKDKAARFGGPVTAILAPNDNFAHQDNLWFREIGLRVPGDLTLLSFDNNHWFRPFSIWSIPVKPDALHNLRSRPVLLGRDTLGSLKGPR